MPKLFSFKYRFKIKYVLISILCLASHVSFNEIAAQNNANAHSLLDSANFYISKDDTKASKFCQEASNIFNLSDPVDSSGIIETKYIEGLIAFNQQDFKVALSIQLDVLNQRKNLRDCDNFDFAMSNRTLGRIYGTLGENKKALEHSLRADSIFEISNHEKAFSTKIKNLGLIAIGYYREGQLRKAISYFNKSIDEDHKLNGEITLHQANMCTNVGVLYSQVGEYGKALESFDKALGFLVGKYGERHIKVGPLYNNMGIMHGALGNIEEAHENYLKTLEINLRQENKNHNSIALAYNNLGTIYKRWGDFEKALIYFEKSKESFQKIYDDPTHEKYFDYYASIASLARDRGELQKSKELAQKSLDLKTQKLGKYHFRTARDYLYLGTANADLKNYNEAIKYYDECLEVYKLEGITSGTHLGELYQSKAEMFLKQKNYSKAIENYNLSKDNYFINDTLVFPGVATIYAKLANTQIQNDQPDIAKEHINKACKYLNLNFADSSYSSLALNYPFDALESLMSYENYFQYQYDNVNSEYADSLIFIHQKIISFHELIIRNFNDPVSKRKFIANARVSFGNAIEDYISFGQIDRAFELSDQLKYTLLNQAIKKETLAKSYNLPDSIIKREAQLQADYNKLKVTIENYNLADNNNDEYIGLQNKYVNTRIEIENLFLTIKENYPTYWQSQYEFRSIPINKIQNNLSDNQTLIEFFIQDEETAYVFVINKNDINAYQIKSWNKIETAIHQYIDALKTNKKNADFQVINNLLYQSLLKPIKDELKFKLILIPDGILSCLPFESIKGKERLILEDHAIAYQYSSSLWFDMEERANDPNKKLLAVAPKFKNFVTEDSSAHTGSRTYYSPLLYNTEEVEQVANIWGGDVLPSTNCDLNSFISIASEYEIIHLATHGKADDKKGDYCYLVFGNEQDSIKQKMYVNDIYSLDLNSEMVVLSACETGIGEIDKGEGIMSLARGFAFAGSKSIIPTLWSINDKSSSTIMINFFSNLKIGMPKDEALRDAKLNYIQQNDDVTAFYWAPFIAIGDMSPINTGFISSSFTYPITLLFLSFVLFLFFKSKSN